MKMSSETKQKMSFYGSDKESIYRRLERYVKRNLLEKQIFPINMKISRVICDYATCFGGDFRIEIAQQLKKKVRKLTVTLKWTRGYNCMYVICGNVYDGLCYCENMIPFKLWKDGQEIPCATLGYFLHHNPGRHIHPIQEGDCKEYPWMMAREFQFLTRPVTLMEEDMRTRPVVWVEEATLLVLWMGKLMDCPFGLLPYELVLMIAKLVFYSCTCEEWKK